MHPFLHLRKSRIVCADVHTEAAGAVPTLRGADRETPSCQTCVRQDLVQGRLGALAKLRRHRGGQLVQGGGKRQAGSNDSHGHITHTRFLRTAEARCTTVTSECTNQNKKTPPPRLVAKSVRSWGSKPPCVELNVGASIVNYSVSVVPYYNYSIMGLKALL